MRQTLLFAAVTAVVSVCAEPSEYRLLSDGQTAFFSLTRSERETLFRNEEYRKKLLALGDKPQAVFLPCPSGGKAVIREIGESSAPLRRTQVKKMEVEAPGYLLISPAADCIRVENLKIGTKYRWHTGDGLWREFVTAATPPRMMRVGRIGNFRDLGGRVGYGGRRVRQGLIYRSAELNGYAGGRRSGKVFLDDATRRYLTEWLGVRTDIDLRAGRDVRGMTGSPAGPEVAWQHVSFAFYAELHTQSGRNAAKRVLSLLMDEKNLPALIHCIAGQDRTGTVALLINGLLGVDEEELYRDWEASCFATADLHFNHRDRFYKLTASFDNYPGATLNERIEAFVYSLGVTREEVAKWRQKMLAPQKQQL